MQSIKLVGFVAMAMLSLTDTSFAQLEVAGEGRVIYGHHHFNVTNLGEQRRFWVDTLGGTAAPFGDSEIIKFTNVILFMREETPAGGTKGSTVNHIGFTVPDLKAVLDRIEAAGYAVVTDEEVPATMQVNDGIAYNEVQDAYLGFVMAPNDIKIEFIGAPEQPEVAKLHHIHFATPDIGAMQAWYASTLGAIPGMRGNFQAADLPGVNLTFSGSDMPLAATKGRSLDHIGFEVANLKAFCDDLEKQGIVFDVPYREIKELDLAIAFFTDPFGTYVELTEGLDRI